MSAKGLKRLCGAWALVGMVSACHDDNGSTAPPPTPPAASTTQNFSTFTTNIFAMEAYTYPVNFDTVTLVYDVNEDPTAFDALLM